MIGKWYNNIYWISNSANILLQCCHHQLNKKKFKNLIVFFFSNIQMYSYWLFQGSHFCTILTALFFSCVCDNLRFDVCVIQLSRLTGILRKLMGGTTPCVWVHWKAVSILLIPTILSTRNGVLTWVEINIWKVF